VREVEAIMDGRRVIWDVRAMLPEGSGREEGKRGGVKDWVGMEIAGHCY